MASARVNAEEPVGLRKQAAARLQEKQPRSRGGATEMERSKTEMQRFVHELQVHQIELEMQNEELKTSRLETEAWLALYTELYDFAPVGYLTLDHNGKICRLNLVGAQLLGAERGCLLDRPFGTFVVGADRPAFNVFLKRVFAERSKGACEVALCKGDKSPVLPEPAGRSFFDETSQRQVRIEASMTADGQHCRAVMSDITARKKMDEMRDFLAKHSGPAQGEGFFEMLARYLAEQLDMEFIFIGRLEGDGLTARSLAAWCNGKFEDNVSYALKDTPCGEVVGKAVCCFPANVCRLFPHDQVLQDFRVESYAGATLWGHTGQAIGLIAAMGRRPLANRPLTEDIMQLVAMRAAGEMERLAAEEQLRASLEQVRRAVETTIQVLVMAVETKDPYTAGHQRRATDLARTLAAEMGLSPEKIEGLRMAGVIHDIGKITLPTEILSKPTKLSDIEFSLIKEHVQLAYNILKDVESPWPLAEIVYQHHERLDGSGYPRGLKGEEITIEARILAVADVVEAMASHRPYRPALGLDAALAEIEKHRGRLYDSGAVDACLRVFREQGYQLEEV